ncbi:LysM peptidoglycan-binding domain-containing protein [Holospora curviuscula]|uniref:LysM domain protein n=1 Tax=Holospora curviuscula TaxID=1082868 RepID=A0A2S5R7R4_9PROT|nr:LysM peptidoglycan-binding domain-containing protein [Holospora curviuscula]PPE03333.1 LysM domain protein [Holospora curviuscula]
MQWVYHLFFLGSIILGGCSEAPLKTIVLKMGQISVSSSDTIYSIAKAHDVSVRALVEANNLRAPYILEEGQILTLPSKAISSSQQSSEDDLDVMANGPVDLAQDTWKDVPLEGDPSEAMGRSSELEPLPTPTIPVPHAEEKPLEEKKKLAQETDPNKSFSVSQEIFPPSIHSSKASSFVSTQKKKDRLVRSGKKSLNNPDPDLVLQAPVSGSIKEVLDKQTAIFNTQSKAQVVACEEGVVVYAGKCGQFHKDPSLANKSFVFVAHNGIKGGKWTSVYLGVLPSVKKDQKVKRGGVLGVCQENVLRFQLRKDRVSVNPKPYFK